MYFLSPEKSSKEVQIEDCGDSIMIVVPFAVA